jgi:hypothetical protein
MLSPSPLLLILLAVLFLSSTQRASALTFTLNPRKSQCIITPLFKNEYMTADLFVKHGASGLDVNIKIDGPLLPLPPDGSPSSQNDQVLELHKLTVSSTKVTDPTSKKQYKIFVSESADMIQSNDHEDLRERVAFKAKETQAQQIEAKAEKALGKSANFKRYGKKAGKGKDKRGGRGRKLMSIDSEEEEEENLGGRRLLSLYDEMPDDEDLDSSDSDTFLYTIQAPVSGWYRTCISNDLRSGYGLKVVELEIRQNNPARNVNSNPKPLFMKGGRQGSDSLGGRQHLIESFGDEKGGDFIKRFA